MDEQKLSHYAQGTLRKSKREKEKEAAEAKRKEEEENAAKAYAEFLHTFQGEDADRRKPGAAFVKAGQEPAHISSRSGGESSRGAQMFMSNSGVRYPLKVRNNVRSQKRSPRPPLQ